jgi:hypothetical protein
LHAFRRDHPIDISHQTLFYTACDFRLVGSLRARTLA